MTHIVLRSIVILWSVTVAITDIPDSCNWAEKDTNTGIDTMSALVLGGTGAVGR